MECSDGVQAGAVHGGLEQDQGVGGVLLAKGPGLLVGWVAEEAGGRCRFELERLWGIVGFEEGEELGGQFEKFVGCWVRGLVEWNGVCCILRRGVHGGSR